MIIHAENNCAYTNLGSFVMGYKMRLPEIYTLGEKQIIEAQRQFIDLVKRMPPNTFLQRIDAQIPYTFTGEALPNKTFLQQAYKNHIAPTQGFQFFSYLFFSTSSFDSFSKDLRNPFSLNTKSGITADNFINESFKGLVAQEVNTLNKSKIFTCVPLSENELKYFSFLYFNLFEEKYSSVIDLFCNIKHKDTAINIKVGDQYLGGFSLYTEKQLPNELASVTSDSLMQNQNKDFLVSLGDIFGIYMQKPHIISTIICRNNMSEWEEKLKNRANNFKRMSFLPGTGFEKKADDLYKFREDLKGAYSDKILVQSNTNVFFWENNIDKFLAVKDDIASYFNQQNILPKYIVGTHLRNAFVTTNPIYMCANNDSNMYPNLAEIPVSFIPVLGNYKQDTGEGCYFTDRFNMPVKIDLWDKEKRYIKARNAIMIAPTGEGKSFFLMEVLRQLEELGIVLVVIDLGKSFKRYAKLLGEKSAFVEYDNDKPLGINPFACIHEDLLKADKLNSLSDFVFSHLNIDREIREMDKAFLTNILRDYIESEKTLSFPGFIHWIIAEENTIKKKYAEILAYFDFKEMKIFLQDFIGKGRYAYLYKGKETTEIADMLKNKKLVVFEIDKAQNDVRILSVLLQTIKDTIYTNIWTDKSKRGIVLFEEFAKTLGLQGGSILRQVEFYFQAIRKQEGGIWIVLQNISQIPENSTAQSILGNCQITFAFTDNTAQGKKFIERMIKAGENKNTDVQENQYLSLKSNLKSEIITDTKYSEVFVRRGSQSNIYRVNVSPQQALVYVTDGKDNVRMEKLTETMSVEEAIKSILNK